MLYSRRHVFKYSTVQHMRFRSTATALTVQARTRQDRTVQDNTVQYNTVRYSQYSTVQYSTIHAAEGPRVISPALAGAPQIGYTLNGVPRALVRGTRAPTRAPVRSFTVQYLASEAEFIERATVEGW